MSYIRLLYQQVKTSKDDVPALK